MVKKVATTAVLAALITAATLAAGLGAEVLSAGVAAVLTAGVLAAILATVAPALAGPAAALATAVAVGLTVAIGATTYLEMGVGPTGLAALFTPFVTAAMATAVIAAVLASAALTVRALAGVLAAATLTTAVVALPAAEMFLGTLPPTRTVLATVALAIAILATTGITTIALAAVLKAVLPERPVTVLALNVLTAILTVALAATLTAALVAAVQVTALTALALAHLTAFLTAPLNAVLSAAAVATTALAKTLPPAVPAVLAAILATALATALAMAAATILMTATTRSRKTLNKVSINSMVKEVTTANGEAGTHSPRLDTKGVREILRCMRLAQRRKLLVILCVALSGLTGYYIGKSITTSYYDGVLQKKNEQVHELTDRLRKLLSMTNEGGQKQHSGKVLPPGSASLGTSYDLELFDPSKIRELRHQHSNGA